MNDTFFSELPYMKIIGSRITAGNSTKGLYIFGRVSVKQVSVGVGVGVGVGV